MDRLGFLSSMPFLVPMHSGLPRSSSAGRKMETLIAPQESYQFEVSLEPIVADDDSGQQQQQQNNNLQNIQPAFFSRPSSNNASGDNGGAKQQQQDETFDPAMANIQVILESPAANNSHLEEKHSSSQQDDPSVLQGRVLFGNKQQQQQQPGSSSSTSTSATPSSHQQRRSNTNQHLQQIQPPQPVFMGDSAAVPTFMFFKIDQGVFQVDGRHLMHVELIQPKNIEGADNNDGSNKSGQKSQGHPQLPPSLRLVFPCCAFRIFPLQTPPNDPDSSAYADTQKNNDWSQHALEALQLLEKRLKQLPYHSAHAVWSPTGSSVQTSSNEAGQKETVGPQSHSHSTLTSSGSTSSRAAGNNAKKLKGSSSTTTSPTNTAAGATKAVKDYNHTLFQDNHQIRKVKRRRDALWRSRAGLQAVETILEMPLTVYTPDTTLANLVPTLSASSSTNKAKATNNNMTTDSAISEGAEPKTQVHGNNNTNNNRMSLEESADPSSSTVPVMGPLLGGVAEEMTNAYGTAQETAEAMQLYQREIEETRNHRVDSLLNSFFPEKRHAASGKKSRRGQSYSSNRSRRHSHKHASSNHNGEDGDGGGAAEEMKPVEEVMASMKVLIQKQKELVEDRSSFLMLPTRG